MSVTSSRTVKQVARVDGRVADRAAVGKRARVSRAGDRWPAWRRAPGSSPPRPTAMTRSLAARPEEVDEDDRQRGQRPRARRAGR